MNRNARNRRFATSLLLFFATCVLFFAFGCQKKPSYSDRFSASELSQKAMFALPQTVFLQAPEDYLNTYLTEPIEASDACIFFASDSSNLNEFGIYKTAPEQLAHTKELLQGYLSHSFERNRSFYDSYIPQQTPKLRDAEVRIYGNYVAYAILDSNDRKSFFDAIEQALLASNPISPQAAILRGDGVLLRFLVKFDVWLQIIHKMFFKFAFISLVNLV